MLYWFRLLTFYLINYALFKNLYSGLCQSYKIQLRVILTLALRRLHLFLSLTLDAIRTAFGLLSEIRLRHWRLVQIILYYQNVALSFIIQRLLGLSVPLSSFCSTQSPSFLNFNILMGKNFLARLLTLLIFLHVD